VTELSKKRFRDKLVDSQGQKETAREKESYKNRIIHLDR